MTKLAQRLGLAPGARAAIVHVDDIGLCHAANRGAFAALRSGPATCGSLMTPCPWFRQAAGMARERPGVDLGVHLTLNCEWDDYGWGPVLDRSQVPSLVDERGWLPKTVAELAARAKPAEVALELRAQVQRALQAGVDVTHLDSHMGSAFLPQLLPIYAELGREFRVPVFAPRPDQAALEAAGLGESAGLVSEILDGLEADGFPILDGFDANSLGFAEGAGAEHNRARIAGLPPGVSYLICHAAEGGPELSAAVPGSAHQRDFERRFYGGEAGRRALREAGVETLGMRPLRDLLRGAGR